MFQARLSSFQRLALWTTAATYLLILVGGLVRASGAGLGCPDWPRCFGGWIPPSSAAELPPQFDPAQFNLALMWTEYSNRLLGMTVGFLIMATVVSAWRHHRHAPRILWPSVAALLLTGFEGWLGGRVVAHELAAWIVTTHLVVALVIVQLLLYATVEAFAEAEPEGSALQEPRGEFAEAEPEGSALQEPRAEPLTRGAEPLGSAIPSLIPSVIALIVMTLVQVTIGTQVRGGIDAALDADVPRAGALATVGWIDALHRNSALVVFGGALAVMLLLWWKRPGDRRLTPWANAVAGLATLQVALGVVMAYIFLVPAAQILHLTVASLLLGAETVLLLLAWKDSEGLRS
jgi:heme a synthase